MKGRHLYEVEVDANDIRYRGDMALYNKAAENVSNTEEMQKLVNDYCARKESLTPMIEVMAVKCVVQRQLHTAVEGKRLFREKYFSSHNTEPDIDEIIDQKESG
jgi:hypothetical protein